MRNYWVLLKGLLSHTPNYSSTKKGLQKVSFRLAIPRLPRAPEETTPPAPEGEDATLLPEEDLKGWGCLESPQQRAIIALTLSASREFQPQRRQRRGKRWHPTRTLARSCY